MAFVNKQGGAEKHEDRSAAGEPIDFDPSDPKVVKVHYDLSAWTFDQRAELAEALADASLPHAWDGDELLVPEAVESDTDVLFDRLEAEIGPFPVALEDDAEATEFGLDEWTDADRAVLTQALVEAEIPHRWDGSTVVVAHDAEDAVDDLLDAIEAGELMGVDGNPATEAPDGVLSDIFLVVDRLAKEPFDASARRSLIGLHDQIDARHAPYAVAPRAWQKIVEGVASIVDRILADAEGDHVKNRAEELEESSDVIGLAQSLRETVREFV